MLGFSATVWVSYGRTGWYCQMAMVCCIIILLENFFYKNKKTTFMFAGIMSILAIVQMLYNYKHVFTL